MKIIEQSYEHGLLYLSSIDESSLESKKISPSEVQFGRYRAIEIRKFERFIFVTNRNTQEMTIYENNEVIDEDFALLIETHRINYKKCKRFFYYYGLAKYKREIIPYFIKNEPKVSIEDIPDTHTFYLPITLQDLSYEQTFTYLPEFKELLKDVKAAYTDRYKRPVKLINEQVFPTTAQTVKTRLKDLKECSYPIVVCLDNTNYGVLDLEPGYTQEDLEHYNAIEGYYEDETPRGGKHKLVKMEENDKNFKYRYSKHLEIINNALITFYGINAKMLHNDPSVLDTSCYTINGKWEERLESVPIKQAKNLSKEDEKSVETTIKMLSIIARQNASTSKKEAEKLFYGDADTSHGEYTAMFCVYRNDIYPFRQTIEEHLLPHVLYQYTFDMFPHRKKHDTMRNSMPYLLYLATKVIAYMELHGSNK